MVWASMPKAAVHEDRNALIWENDIRIARYAFAVEIKSLDAHFNPKPDESRLEPSIFAPNGRHDSRSCFLVDYVHAYTNLELPSRRA